ncbi:FAD:protein FMN transferase [Streptomyces sp. AD2-2]|nr:FAD:protein FMN transferase [Streptomyces sp. AD2-2]
MRVQDVTGSVDETPEHGTYATVALRSGGLATSGTAARRWRRNGHELHHIVDPRTGLPVRSPWRTVSVAAASSTESPQSWWAATKAPGFRPRKRPNAPWTRATWGPESSRHSPSTAAEWPKPPESSATWPCNRPASAAPASTASRA